jgi:undecaprenyl-diphosphatase
MTHFLQRFAALVFLATLVLPLACRADTAPEKTAEPSSERMDYTDAAVLGAVEGVTEYLPVSSTGHLILTKRALGLDEADASGKTQESRATDAYLIVIQVGAIAAVAILYWRDLLAVLLGFCGKNREGLRLGINLLVAFLPAALVGFLLNDWIEEKLFGTMPVVIALAAGAPLMLGAEFWRKRRFGSTGTREVDKELHELTLPQCLLIGGMQCIAMAPGTSRSMMTIVGGYFAGLSPVKSARFSFLLGLITLSAATGYTLLRHGRDMAEFLDTGPVLLGLFVATVTAALSVKWLVAWLSGHGLSLFAYYRIALAIIILAVVSC